MKQYLWYDKWKFAAILLVKMAFSAAFVGFSLMLQWLVNTATAEGSSVGAFLAAVGWCVAYTAGVVLLMLLKDKLTYAYVNRAIGKLRDALGHKLLNIRYSDYAKEDSALYLSRLTNDMKTLGTNYFTAVMALPDQIFTFVFAVAAAFYINYAVALVMLGLTLLIFIVPAVFNKPLNRANMEVSEKIKEYTRTLKQTFLGMDVVKNFNAQEEIGGTIRQANEQLIRKTTKIDKLNAYAMDIGILIVVLLQLGSIAISGYLMLQGVLLIGAVLAVVQLSGNMYQPLMEIAGKIALIGGVGDLNRTVLQILEIEQEQPKRSMPVCNDIETVDLRYAYADGQQILKGVDAYFESGKKYLIVGKSGSGKSTLLKLLGKMYSDYGGQITLGGVPYADLTERQIYERVAIAQQSGYVFERSIRDNIDFNRTGDDTRLSEAIRLAELDRFVNENGLDNVIDEEINRISGGEKQRIGLARALYRNSDILLLDEVTASLDKDTAYAVERNILGMRGVTVINVSHKLHKDLLYRYDRIMIMEDGCVRAFLPPEEIVDETIFDGYLADRAQ